MPSSSTHKENLTLINNVYLTIEKNFSKVFAKCKTEQQRRQFRSLHDSARDAFWKAVESRLEDNNETVKAIRKDLRTVSSSIKQKLTTLQDIVAFLKLVAEGVRLSASLATLAATA